MDVTTKCPKCGLLLALDPSLAEEFECPQCGQRLTIQPVVPKATPVKKPPPRKTAASGPPVASHTDDIDWSIPEIPQRYKRRKRTVELDPAVVWSILIVGLCIVALIVGGVYLSRSGGISGLASGDPKTTMFAYAPDDWDVQALVKIAALQRHPHRNSMLLFGLKPASAPVGSEVDELLLCEGAARTMVLTTLGEAPSLEDFRKQGGSTETYHGHAIFRRGATAFSRISNKAVAVAEHEFGLKRMIDASRSSSRSPPDLPKDYTAVFRIRARAIRARTALPDWMAPFEVLGVSIKLHDDGGASLFFFGEAASEAAAKETVPQMERVRGNFREQLGAVRTLFRGSIGDLERLSSALANNAVAADGKRVGLRCVVAADHFAALFQPQLRSLGEPRTTSPPAYSPPTSTPFPPPSAPTDPQKQGVPAFVGQAADYARQAQEVLAGQFGRERTVMIVGYGFQAGTEQERLSQQLIELLKRFDVQNYNTSHSGGWTACVFAPIADLDALAKAIDFAVVAQIVPDQRRIFVTPKK